MRNCSGRRRAVYYTCTQLLYMQQRIHDDVIEVIDLIDITPRALSSILCRPSALLIYKPNVYGSDSPESTIFNRDHTAYHTVLQTSPSIAANAPVIFSSYRLFRHDVSCYYCQHSGTGISNATRQGVVWSWQSDFAKAVDG